jgi:hypothetical protein
LGNIVFAADTYVYAAGNVGNTAQSGGNLVIGTTTAAKTVKIFAGGNTTSALVANISNTGVAVIGAISATGNVTAQNFVGNISITGNVVGTSPNVTITAGSYGWTFDNTGNLQGNITFTGANVLINNSSGAGGSDEGGQLNFAAATANTSLNGPIAIDVYQNKMRFFETTGNNRGAYLDLSQASTSAGTLLNNRVSAANLALNTSLTFDNLAIQIKTQNAGVWIFAATVSGTATYQYAITYQIGGGTNTTAQGTNSTMSATTTPTSIGLTSWSFATAAQLVTVVLTDTTANKMYRITWQITTGSSPFGSFVSIERLV